MSETINGKNCQSANCCIRFGASKRTRGVGIHNFDTTNIVYVNKIWVSRTKIVYFVPTKEDILQKKHRIIPTVAKLKMSEHALWYLWYFWSPHYFKNTYHACAYFRPTWFVMVRVQQKFPRIWASKSASWWLRVPIRFGMQNLLDTHMLENTLHKKQQR